MKPLRIAIIGVSGFAATHHETIQQLEKAGICTLICTCDPNITAFLQSKDNFDLEGRGVCVFGDYIEMLDSCKELLDVVVVPTPIMFHAEMHRACVERDLAVYLEKPPTLDWQVLEGMLKVEKLASRLTNVGFNYIDEPARQALKLRILSGEWGKILKIGLKGAWPRSQAYYSRNSWAGRLLVNGSLVLDSCMGNALSHYVHNALFWAGRRDLYSWAGIKSVRAELYRAHNIESADTVFSSAILDDGVVLDMALTHACDGLQNQHEWVVCEKATLHYSVGNESRIHWNNGTVDVQQFNGTIGLSDTLLAYFAYIRGLRERPTTRLEDCRPFVHLCDAIYVAAGKITTVADAHLTYSRAQSLESKYVAIRDIRTVIDRFFDGGAFPSEQGVPWGASGGYAEIADVTRLAEVVIDMQRDEKMHGRLQIYNNASQLKENMSQC